MKITHSPNKVIRGLCATEDFRVLTSALPVAFPSTTATVTDKDVLATVTDAVHSAIGLRLDVLPSTDPVTFENLTPDLAQLDGNIVVPTATGAVRLHATVKGKGTRLVQGAVEYRQSSVSVVSGYVSGSLAHHIHSAITAMTSGQSPGHAARVLYSTANYSTDTPAGVRNPNLFAGSLDLSAISFCRPNGFAFPVVLVGPRHVVFARHIGPAVGSPITWQRPDGSFQTVTLLGKADVSVAADIGVGYLSEAVTGIAPMKILPDNWATYLPCLHLSSGYVSKYMLPALLKDARGSDYVYRNEVDVVPVRHISAQTVVLAGWFNGPYLDNLNAWHDAVVGGDSGSPLMLPINGQAVLLSCQHTIGGAGNLSAFRTGINAAMNALAGSTGHQIGTAELSAFPAF